MAKIDLRTCEAGDILISSHGAVLQYVEPTQFNTHYTYLDHVVQYVMYADGALCGDGNFGTRTHDGFVFSNNRQPDIDHDIVRIIKKFDRAAIEMWLPQSFKGLSKDYMLECIFNINIQKKWIPQEGDIIVGCTGNVFVIGGVHKGSDEVGGDLYLFGGDLCNRDGGCLLDSASCYTMNDGGLVRRWVNDELCMVEDFGHSKISDFRFVPYPHEIDRL